MKQKPTLEEFIQKYPNKGLNDYYKKYGDPPPIPPLSSDSPPSYIRPKKRERSRINLLDIIASVLLLVSFFLPWLDISLLEKMTLEEGATPLLRGLDMQHFFEQLSLPQFSASSHLTAYLIPIGAMLALIGEIIRSWAVRSIGQVLAVSFAVYWWYKIYVVVMQSDYRPETIEWMSLFQYGLFMLAAAVLFYFVDIIRTLTGKR